MGRSREAFRVASLSCSTKSSYRRCFAMAPLACLYGHARTERFMALALGFLGLLPFVSIDHPAEQPFEALAPVLVSYLSFALAVAGLLVSAGSMRRDRKPRGRLAESASAELPDRQSGTPDVSRAVARGNPPLGAALCWLALAHSLGLGSLAFHFEMDRPIAQPIRLGVLVTSHAGLFTPRDGTLGLHVLRFADPARSGSFTGAGRPIMLPSIWWLGHRALPDVIALCLSAAGLFWKDVATRPRAE